MKGMYDHPKEVRAARGLKIAAQNLESAVAGTQLLVARKEDDLETLKQEVMEDMHDIFSSVDRSGVPDLDIIPSIAEGLCWLMTLALHDRTHCDRVGTYRKARLGNHVLIMSLPVWSSFWRVACSVAPVSLHLLVL